MSEPGNGGYPPPPYGEQPSHGQQQYPSAPPPGYGYGYPQPRPGNPLAIASLVCGIVGFLLLGVVLGPLAAIFGGVALSKANKGASGKGMAIAGLVLGLIDTILAIVLLVALANKRVVI